MVAFDKSLLEAQVAMAEQEVVRVSAYAGRSVFGRKILEAARLRLRQAEARLAASEQEGTDDAA